jgi:hypothetical protein
VLEAFYDSEGRAWKDGFDRTRWRLIFDRHRDLFCGRDFGLRQEGHGLDIANAGLGFEGLWGRIERAKDELVV